MSSNKIIQLFSGQATTGHGDSLASLRELSDEDLETRHDYIQYMFPSEEVSQFNSVAPVVTPDVIEEFKRREDLRSELILNFKRILSFWDFNMTEDKEGKVTVWLKPEFNANPADDVVFRNTSKFHNFLRLTRVIKSLHVLGCTKHAVAFRDFACDALVNTIKVPLTTVKFWKTSINDDPSPAPGSASATTQLASEPEPKPPSGSSAETSSTSSDAFNSSGEEAQMQSSNIVSKTPEFDRTSEAQESNRGSDVQEADIGAPDGHTMPVQIFERVSDAQGLDRHSEAPTSNRGSDMQASRGSPDRYTLPAQMFERVSEAPASDRSSDMQEINQSFPSRHTVPFQRVSDAEELNKDVDSERHSEPAPTSGLQSSSYQGRASEGKTKGRRASLNPEAQVIDPEHGDTVAIARAQEEEAITAAKLAEAERNFVERAEKLEAEQIAIEEKQRKQLEEIERNRAQQRAKEEEDRMKKDRSLTNKFMKLGEKAVGWTMGEQKNRHINEKPPIVFKGVNDFSPKTGNDEQMELQRQEELRRKKAESEQCFGCMNALM